MARKKITALTELTTPSADDVIPIVQIAGGPITKKIKYSNLYPFDPGLGLLRPMFNYRLRAFWPHQGLGFVNGASVVTDWHPTGSHLTVSGTGRVLLTPINVWYSTFNGISGYNYVAINSSINMTDDFGFGCWMMVKEKATSHGIFRIGSTTVGASANIFLASGVLNFEYGYWDIGGTYRNGVSMSLPSADYLDKWIFFACDHNYTGNGDNTFRMRVNEEYDIETNKAYANPMRTPVGNFELGRGATAPNYLNGNILTAWIDFGYTQEWETYFQATRGYFGV